MREMKLQKPAEKGEPDDSQAFLVVAHQPSIPMA
jgi:hypothetical protein